MGTNQYGGHWALSITDWNRVDVPANSDEFELEFFSLSPAMKVASQAKQGNFCAETELTILTICMLKK